MGHQEIRQKHKLAREALGYCVEEDRHHRVEDFELTRYHRRHSDVEPLGSGRDEECYWCGYGIDARKFVDIEAIKRNKERNFALQEQG